MTHTYALKRLLEHGPLSFAQMVEITGWPYRSVEAAVVCLMESGMVKAEPFGRRRNAYRLVA